MPDQPKTPADLARALGRLIKSYMPDGNVSAHEAMEIMSAFEEGLSDEKRHMVEFVLPLVPRVEDTSSYWDGLFPAFQILAPQMLSVAVGADFLCVEVYDRERMATHNDGQKPSASISVDHDGCGHVRLKTERHEKPKDHLLRQTM